MSTNGSNEISSDDLTMVTQQLGRPVRGTRNVAHRCECGAPDVVETSPALEDGEPFPTLFYLTCPKAASAIGTLEASGLMKHMQERLTTEPDLGVAYRAAHEDYLQRREQIQSVDHIAGISAGGMPDRVKCLHVLAAHSLAAGPGVNPLGDEVLALLPKWWLSGPCSQKFARGPS